MGLQPPADNHSLPMISGFTPINGSNAQAIEVNTVPAKAPNKKDANKKAQTPRDRKNASSSKSAPKVRKQTSSKRGKGKKTDEGSRCQDITKSLARTKPVSSENGLPPERPDISSDVTLGEKNTEDLASFVPTEGEDAAEPDQRSHVRLSRLAEKYQAAYASSNGDSINPSLLHESEAIWGASKYPTVAMNTPTDPWDFDIESSKDFMIPPSGQGDKTDFEVEKLFCLKEPSVPKIASPWCFDSEDVFGEGDDFLTNDDDLAEILHSADSPTKNGDSDADWKPQHFADDPVIFQHSDCEELPEEEASPHWGPTATAEKSGSKQGKKPNHFPDLQDGRVSQPLSQSSGNANKAQGINTMLLEESESCFDDDNLDAELMDLAANEVDLVQPKTPDTSPARSLIPKLQWMPPKTFTPAKSSQSLSSPVSVNHSVPANNNEIISPFTRPPFPNPIPDRPIILGSNNQTVLRTSFRIGEALNAAGIASRNQVDAIFELYARVLSSKREPNGGVKQFFQFGDLFTDKPPFLKGTYSLWKGVELWDVDSRGFVGEKGMGKMARVMGRIKRCEAGGGYEMTILSIWEVDWEDVEVAKGIVGS
ncbi:hypothetical protein ACLMJK_007898 [Lecanora helva]